MAEHDIFLQGPFPLKVALFAAISEWEDEYDTKVDLNKKMQAVEIAFNKVMESYK